MPVVETDIEGGDAHCRRGWTPWEIGTTGLRPEKSNPSPTAQRRAPSGSPAYQPTQFPDRPWICGCHPRSRQTLLSPPPLRKLEIGSDIYHDPFADTIFNGGLSSLHELNLLGAIQLPQKNPSNLNAFKFYHLGAVNAIFTTQLLNLFESAILNSASWDQPSPMTFPPEG